MSADDPLASIDHWPVPNAAAGWARLVDDEVRSATRGAVDAVFPLASLTKPLVSYAVMIAVEEGSLSLDDRVELERGRATIRHLLSHASGISPDAPTSAAPVGERRIYSNAGFDLLGELLSEATGFSAADYLRLAVCEPLGMASTSLQGSPAKDAVGSVVDLLRFIGELMVPTLLAPETLDEIRSPQFPALAGVLPGYGGQDPNPWGLGFELRGAKAPHWTSKGNSRHTFGHFGRSGTMFWVDPVAGLGCVALTDRDFGSWAQEAWPVLSTAVLHHLF